MSFYREQSIKATRKQHLCCGCNSCIEAGGAALYIAATDENNGGIWHGHYHRDCRSAEIALNDVHDIRHGEDWMPLSDAEQDDREWLAKQFPAVAARLFAPAKSAA